MAANEVIFFPFWAQLSPRIAFPDCPPPEVQRAASSSLPAQPEQPRIIGHSEQHNQKGGTPT